MTKKETNQTEEKVRKTRKKTVKEEVKEPVLAEPIKEEEKPEEETVGMKLEEAVSESRTYRTIGEYSEDIALKHRSKRTAEEEEFELYRSLVRYQKNGQILWGTIESVSWENVGGKKIMAVNLLWNGIKVVIPDDWFWLENNDFGNSYQVKRSLNGNGTMTSRTTSVSEKADIRMAVAKFYTNAEICFTVKGASRTLVKEGAFEGQYLVNAIGNRVEACNLIRDKYFFHKNHYSDKEPITIKKGDTVEAHVIGVKEDCVLVEACGVETRLDSYSISNDFITNCMNYCKPGDELDLTVRNVEIRDDRVYLSLTGRTTATPKAILQMKTRSYYSGTVVRFNNDTNLYTIILKNGVRACVHKDRVEGYSDLSYGDSVRVFVTNIKEAFVIGNAIRA